MHRTRHDPNLAALQAGSSLPGHVLDVVVLTADAGLLATLREASGAEHAIWHAQSPDAAVDLLIGGRCAILIADLGALHGDAAAFFDRLHAQFPELVLMATGRRDEEATVASLIGSGLIYRLLHKPVSPARAGLFVAAATRRYHELHNLPPPLAMSAAKTSGARPRLAKQLIIAAVLALLVLCAAVLWLAREDEPPEVVAHRQIETASPAEQVATLLGRAQIAFARDQLAEPRGDNALEHYRAALALQPDHEDAKAGVERVISALEARVLAALEARNAPEGRAALAALQRAEPRHPRLDALQTELITLSRSASASLGATSAPPAPKTTATPTSPASPARAAPAQPPSTGDSPPALPARRGAQEIAERAQSKSEPTQLAPSEHDLKRLAQLRERGALVAPPGANAFEALTAMKAAFPESDALRAEEQRLAFALLEEGRSALAGGALDEAQLMLERAEALVPGMTTTATLKEQLVAAREQRAFYADVVQAAALKRKREVAAVYPKEAEKSGLEGWVDVEFTILPDGSTADLVTRNALRGEIFEKSAHDSVRRWRFEPVVRDGRPVAQRAILRVRFALK